MSYEYIAEELWPLAIPIEDLTEDPENVRLHDERSLTVVANSLERFKQRQPIVARRNPDTGEKVVIAGNARLEAARRLGWTHIAVVSADADDDNEARAYALTDNKSALLSDWDMSGLATVLATLKDEDLDLDALGWSDDELSDILDINIDLDDEETTTEPALPDPPADPVTKLGNLIELGDHRLVCGDATDEQAILKAFFLGESADLMVTDPPYGVSYQMDLSPEEAKKLRRRTDGKVVTNDAMDEDELHDLIKNFSSAARLRPGASFYVFSPPAHLSTVFHSGLSEGGLAPRHHLIWAKDRHVLGRCDYHYRHELIHYGWKEGAGHYFLDDRTQNSVLEFKRPGTSPDHPTMKPIDLVMRLIMNSSKQGDLVYDPFLGSGTTLLAAEKTGRRCFGIELDPAYCDVIVRRWEELTGKKAKRG